MIYKAGFIPVHYIYQHTSMALLRIKPQTATTQLVVQIATAQFERFWKGDRLYRRS